MLEPFSPEGPKLLLQELHRLVRDRAAAEEEISAAKISGKQTANEHYHDALEALTETHLADKKKAEQQYDAARSEIITAFQSDTRRTQNEYDSARQQAAEQYKIARSDAERDLSTGRWEAVALSEAARSGSDLQLQDIISGLETRWQELQNIHRQALELLQKRDLWREFPEPENIENLLEENPSQRFTRGLELARDQYQLLANQFIWRSLQGIWPMTAFLVFWALALAPSIWCFGWNDLRWVAVSGGSAFLVFLPLSIWLHRLANRQVTQAYLALRATLLGVGANRLEVLRNSITQCQQAYGAIAARRNTEIKSAEKKFVASMAEIQRRKEEEDRRIEMVYPARLAELAAVRDTRLQQINEKYPRLFVEIDTHFASETKRLGEQHALALKQNEEHWQRQWQDMADRWFAGIERFRAAIERIEQSCRELFPDWHTSDWNRWTMPAKIPPAIRLGASNLDLSQIEHGLPEDENLLPSQTEFILPTLLPFPAESLLLWEADGAGLAKAAESMQAVMLRMLASMPPGKVRFTIIDPVGLGEDFSAFMHLVDYDEQLVSNRIWTDAIHIEERLSDLTNHMENVIQVYLRKEFQTIQQYNEYAGELAEPYRVLVVANFPANFSDSAAQRLKSIIASGARCGVFVLLSVNKKLPLSRHFPLSDIESQGLTLRWNQSQFVWQLPDCTPLTINLDAPPSAERFNEIVLTAGSQAKDAGRVEVPFANIIPPENKWWSAHSRAGIDVPLGCAGAMKLQHLDLGQGTSQHVLISGKTGSGKSTLLHVLITNLAMYYSPHEVELYLVDFKKGVEFKSYANVLLPHARVIAIESEREFGLSVLQRLDAEMHSRGDMFRKQAVQDLKAFRAEKPDVTLPRILLIIDEFQELFVEDDRIAQESALLLDRLVRQGRAFGIHVLLGSQTLGGAYSLARSTIGQMAVRIALQCSETDAHLILSEDNTAARLLIRPGEAIYNDANGLYEGNHPFQVVWLSDNERDHYLQQITKLAAQKGWHAEPPIIFEGNVLADPQDNPALKKTLSSPERTKSTAARAWLGAAVAIKEPTSVVFSRQNGGNLLLVGHREENVLGVLSNCLISLAAAGNAQFYLLDGQRGDVPEAGMWKRLISTLPLNAKLASVRDSVELLSEINAELGARLENSQDSTPPIYLFIHNLARFRDLRRDEDFSFSSLDNEKKANPAKQFQNILREGPALGIHTLVWCDTYSNVSRFLDRQSLHDFELRVLFQMNAMDSSNLMDTPDAGRLSVHTAIFYDEGQGRMEKFRPYGLPSDAWLTWVKKQLKEQQRNTQLS
ncbi:MAG: FtsK/SpoIIIE domain-containing protein [Thermoguttaceae bacterium]